jgi:hypothetical protein
MTEVDYITTGLLIILGIIIYILLTKKQNIENFQTSEEAVKTIASVYNNNNLSVSNANVTNKLSVGTNDGVKNIPSWSCAKFDNSSNEDNAIILGTKNNADKDIQILNREGSFRIGMYDSKSGSDVLSIERDGSSRITSNSWKPLQVESTGDSHISLKTKGDESKNVYLINRDGGFCVNRHGNPDGFGVDGNGVWCAGNFKVGDTIHCNKIVIHDKTDYNKAYVLEVFQDNGTDLSFSSVGDNSKYPRFVINEKMNPRMPNGQDRIDGFATDPTGNFYINNKQIGNM